MINEAQKFKNDDMYAFQRQSDMVSTFNLKTL